MAREFPDADVLGVDLAPVPAEPESLPSNCRFEVDDINLGLDHFAGQFDLIHIRLVGSGLKDIHKSMSDIEKCLKPGGLVLWLDIDYDLYLHSGNTFTYKAVASELNPSGVWLQRPIYGRSDSSLYGSLDLHVSF
jgi:SAM-dependent methyltransferase